MNYKLLNKNLLALAITTLLATGCGGGGSTSPAASTNNGSIGGAASKGIMKKAIVKVFKVTASGVKEGNALAETVTNDDGTYSLKELPSTGTTPVLLELSVNSGVTTMVCDALNGCGTVAYGADIILPDGFVLRAILPPIDGSKAINTQITPFSDLAAARAIALGNVNEERVNSAISEVSAIFGINIQEVQPVDITKTIATGVSDKQQQYALLNAAIADLAFTDTGSDGIDANDLKANLIKFSEEFKDGILGGDTGLDPKKLFDQVKAQAADQKNSGLSSTARDQATSVADALAGTINADGEFDPKPSAIADNETEVAQAQALITETRQWVASFQDLEKPADVFGIEIETLNKTLNVNTTAAAEVLANTLEQVVTALSNTPDGSDFPSSVDIISKNSNTKLGVVTITDKSTSTNILLSISSTDISGVSLNIILEFNLALSSLSNKDIIKAGAVALTISGNAANDKVKVTLNKSALDIVLASDLVVTDSDNINPNISKLTLTGDLEVASQSAGQPTGDKVSGKTTIELVALTDKNSATKDTLNLSMKKLAFTDLTIATAQGSNSAGLNVSLDIKNAATFDTITFLENNLVETDSNFIEATLNINGKLKLSQNPEATASLLVTKTGLEKGSAVLTIASDGRSLQITLTGDNKVTNSGTGTLTISNPDGVTLTITGKEGGAQGIVKVNDKTVATLEEVNGIVIIRYNDGSFESF